MKKIALVLALVFALFSFAACGNIEIGDETDMNEETEEIKEATRIDVYEIGDILGCWYGASADGEKYLMRIFTNETAIGTEYKFTINTYSDNKAKSLFGDVYTYTDEWEEGVISTSCTLAASLVGGEFTSDAKIGGCALYDDGSFTYMPQYVKFDENGNAMADIEKMEAEKLTFTRNFTSPTLSVDKEGGKLSGMWFAREEDEFFMLELYKNGIFYLYQEEEMVFGTYSFADGTLSLTAHEVAGEEYKGDDATKTVTLDENNNLVMGERVVNAVSGGVSKEYTSDKYTLTLSEDGSFYMNREDNQIVGIYMEEGAGYTLYALAGGGYPEKEICIAEKTDGGLSFYFMSEGDDERIIFTEK